MLIKKEITKPSTINGHKKPTYSHDRKHEDFASLHKPIKEKNS